MKRVLAGLLTGIMVCLAFAGCGKAKADETIATEQIATEEFEGLVQVETEAEEVAPAGMARNYLTGEWIAEDIAAKRPLAIMIENTKAAQPSYGTTNADMYYEYPVEGGITRIMAIFSDYSGLERLGNVRSCRPYFAYTALAYDAIYAHCGGSIDAYEEILDQGLIDNIDERLRDNGYFFRASDKSAPHNLYTSTEGIDKAIDEIGYERMHSASYEGTMKFNKDDNNEIQLDGEDAAVVKVFQADPKPWFEYNEEDGLYYRYEFGEAQMDAAAGKQLAVKNIIIQECTVDAYFDEQNHDRVDIGTLAGGNGKYITNGKAIDITWTCDGNGQPTHYYDKNGNEIELNQGKTWFDITDVSHKDENVIYATKDAFTAAQ